LIEYNPSLNVLFVSLLLAFSAAGALGQCAGKVSSPAAVADCAARETPREGAAVLDPVHPYTLAELIDVAEHHNPSTRTIWERAKQKARELGLAKTAYYPELDGLAVFGDERLINPFPEPLAPRGYVMVEVPIAHTAKLEDMKAADFDTVFYVGGHGPMWDLAESPVSIALLESFYNSGKPIALVCHSPGVLRHVTYKGEPLVKGKHVTGFTNGEEEEVQLTHVVPFLVEDELLRLGAIFEKVADWQPFSVVDGRLITGQNPASSTAAAQSLINLLARKAA
jgi:putative intracellular protease/amidase